MLAGCSAPEAGDSKAFALKMCTYSVRNRLSDKGLKMWETSPFVSTKDYFVADVLTASLLAKTMLWIPVFAGMTFVLALSR